MRAIENGNPVTLTKTRENVVRWFREELEERLTLEPAYLEPLRGKCLACWCGLDELCHADVLLELANR